ncbi:hypothetical protein DXD91_02570 [Anaerobutyricum hallii]|uniref:Uncharacterized protein n=1 Tax=Anaerobutyricum hallii TaxID=39488 RepID=A0A374NUD1_9FIRM|nr:hypothetical protein DXD91_02570 [Anaerobutyricum hallii]
MGRLIFRQYSSYYIPSSLTIRLHHQRSWLIRQKRIFYFNSHRQNPKKKIIYICGPGARFGCKCVSEHSNRSN